MSDTEITEAVQEDPAAAEEPKTFDAEYVQKLRAEAAKHRTEAKANAEAAKRLAEIEEANKTEAQKSAERLADLEAQLNGYQSREQVAGWKAEVAEATGVPAVALAGSTKEEIEAHAATLKPLITAAAAPTGHQPVPSAGTGAALPLNGDGIESALKNALGIQ